MEQVTRRKPTSRQYEAAALDLRLSYAPVVYACCKCGWPVRDGYCCGTCGDNNPSDPPERKAPFKLNPPPVYDEHYAATQEDPPGTA
jgi:hypothetical protein